MKNIRSGGGSFLLAVLLLLSWSGAVLAAEFSADQVREEKGGQEPVITGKVYVTDKAVRLETSQKGQDMVTLVDRVREKSYLLRLRARIYLERPFGAAQAAILMTPEALARMGKVEELGREELDGFVCRRYKVVYLNPHHGEAAVWRAEKLDFPLKVIAESPRGRVVTRYTNIKAAPQDQSLFELPRDFRKMAPRTGPAQAGQ